MEWRWYHCASIFHFIRMKKIHINNYAPQFETHFSFYSWIPVLSPLLFQANGKLVAKCNWNERVLQTIGFQAILFLCKQHFLSRRPCNKNPEFIHILWSITQFYKMQNYLATKNFDMRRFLWLEWSPKPQGFGCIGYIRDFAVSRISECPLYGNISIFGK